MRVLITAFEPYDQWSSNSSWEVLTELLKTRGVPAGLTTRRYPVNLEKLKGRLFTDLERGFDAVLHLGQRPGIGWLSIESIAINVAGITDIAGSHFGPIVEGGAVAYQTQFDIARWRTRLTEENLPSSISYHAGTYLCNAIFYLTHHWYRERAERAAIGFVHLPLTQEQAVASGRELPSLSKTEMARGLGVILDCIAMHASTDSVSQFA